MDESNMRENRTDVDVLGKELNSLSLDNKNPAISQDQLTDHTDTSTAPLSDHKDTYSESGGMTSTDDNKSEFSYHSEKSTIFEF